MSEPRRRRLGAAERRAIILAAAGRLFAERGYDGARLDDIAAAAGVTKPILYRHFPNKERLYLALLERHRQDLGRLSDAIPTGGPLEDRLRGALDTWLAYAEGHSYAWTMLFRDTGGGPEIGAFRRDVHVAARGVLAATIEAMSEWPVPPVELEPLAEMLTMGMASLVLWSIDEPTVSGEALVDAMTRLWTRLLRASPES